MSGDRRFQFTEAFPIAAEIVNRMRIACERIEIAGSLRRRKDDVGDIEIVYIPVMREDPDPGDMFGMLTTNCAEGQIRRMIASGALALRKTATGRLVFGEKNKLLVHVASGIPVDLFATTREAWFNYLVCRTGPAESNKRVASAAIAHGMRWNPYGPGFTLSDGAVRAVTCERDVFAFVGLPYFDPERRV